MDKQIIKLSEDELRLLESQTSDKGNLRWGFRQLKVGEMVVFKADNTRTLTKAKFAANTFMRSNTNFNLLVGQAGDEIKVVRLNDFNNE